MIYEHQDGLECLPLYFYNLTPKLKQQAIEELNEDDNLRTALDELLRMIKDTEGNDSLLNDEELIPFLRVRKFDVTRAYNTFRKHCKAFCSENSLFNNFDFASNLKPVLSNFFCLRPKRDIDGCVVVCVFLRNWKLQDFDMSSILKLIVMSLMDIVRCPISQITGVKYVADCSSMSLSHVLLVRPWHLKYFSDICQNSMPMRMKGLHFVNNNSFTYLLWLTLKTFLSANLIKRVHFHGTDLKSLHKHVSPSILPEEVGGNMGPQDNTEWLETFSQSESFLTNYIYKLRAKNQNK